MSEDFPDLNALKTGDRAAWDEAFRHLWPIALRAAQHWQACPEEAEDAASHAMSEFVRKIGRVTNANHARALTATFARNCAIGSIRREAAIKRSRPENFELACAETPPSAELTEIEHVEMLVLLGQALAILEPVTRLILEEKFVHGLTCDEIHRRHGIPLGTVCTKLARGLKTVRAYLEESPLLMKELRGYLR